MFPLRHGHQEQFNFPGPSLYGCADKHNPMVMTYFRVLGSLESAL